MTINFHIQQGPIGADPRIDYDHVNRLGRKIWDGSSEKKSGEADVLRRNLMTEINEAGVAIQAENNPFHRRGIRRFTAEIGGQRDQRLHGSKKSQAPRTNLQKKGHVELE